MRRRLDDRLSYLLRVQSEAQRDVRQYVERRWPVGARVRYERKGITERGVVVRHCQDAYLNIKHEGGRLRRVPYQWLKDTKR